MHQYFEYVQSYFYYLMFMLFVICIASVMIQNTVLLGAVQTQSKDGHL